ncbi:MAG: hypothetical protein ACRCUS_04845 [Anaerovoracaceae bacterium]
MINFLVTVGWYILYGGLIIIGLMLLFIMVKCFCTVMGERMCSNKLSKGDELTVIEKLIDVQAKGHKRFSRRKRSITENPLL